VTAQLEGKILREIHEDDLSDYFYLAVLHIGTPDHFKHFLPRVLELVADSPHGPTATALLDRLRDADVGNWTAEEREVICDFFRATPATLGDFGIRETSSQER
jgi:hypothetical protein